jgi:iron(III) transport system ATP-binding protein
MSVLELSGLRKSFGSAVALAGVDLRMEQGSRTAVVGPSGCGKTTLLRIVAGFESPDQGQLTLDGRRLADASGMVPAHLREVGFVPQDGALFPHLTVAANVGFGLPRDMPRRDERISQLMDMVALDGSLLQRRPHELSGGQQQRVALARALARQPKLMLLDEPFSSLDAGLRAATRKAVAQLLSDAGIATILVTHDQAEALAFADQLAVMDKGRFVQVGAPTDLYWRPVNAGTAKFLGQALLLQARIADGWAQCILGRVAVDDTQLRGDAQIMLRPEQLLLRRPTADRDEGCEATVTDAVFCGAEYELAVEVSHGPVASTLMIRCPSTFAPRTGEKIGIAVQGTAHPCPD